MLRQQASEAAKKIMCSTVQDDTAHFSDISMRSGGISQAVHARVPEPILFLQSGHGTGIAARNHVVSQDPRVPSETAKALLFMLRC